MMLLPQAPRRSHPQAVENDGDKADGNQHFPAQTHDLVVAVAREGGANPQIAVEHKGHFGKHPNRAGRTDDAPALREGREPAAKEHNRGERAD